MIKERARVLDVQDGRVLLETVRSSACASCSAKGACGQGLMGEALGSDRMSQKSQIWVSSSSALIPGQEVWLEVPEDSILNSALLAYLLPLVGLIGGAVVGRWLTQDERASVALAVVGLAASYWLSRWIQRSKYFKVIEPRLSLDS